MMIIYKKEDCFQGLVPLKDNHGSWKIVIYVESLEECLTNALMSASYYDQSCNPWEDNTVKVHKIVNPFTYEDPKEATESNHFRPYTFVKCVNGIKGRLLLETGYEGIMFKNSILRLAVSKGIPSDQPNNISDEIITNSKKKKSFSLHPLAIAVSYLDPTAQRLIEAIQGNPQWMTDPIQVPNVSSSNADVETIAISDSSDIFDQDTIAIEDSNTSVAEDSSGDDDVFDDNPVGNPAEGATNTTTTNAEVNVEENIEENVEESAYIRYLRRQSQRLGRLLTEQLAATPPTLQSPEYYPTLARQSGRGHFHPDNQEDDGWGQYPVAREVLSSRLRPRIGPTVTLPSASTSDESVIALPISPVLPETITLTSTSASEGSIIVDYVGPEPEVVRNSSLSSSGESVKILATPPTPPNSQPTKMVGTAHPIRRPDLN